MSTASSTALRLDVTHTDAAATCPLCSLGNDCAFAAGRRKGCWCFEVEISDDARGVAEAMGAEERCVCRRCAVPASQ